MEKKKYFRAALIAAALIIIITISGYIAAQNDSGGGQEESSSSSAEASSSGEETEEETGSLQETESEYNLIEGGYSFFEDDVLPEDADPSEYVLPESVCGIDLPYAIEDAPLIITRIAKYSGEYIEDASDDEIDSCLALIVKNNTDDIVMTATLVFKVNDSEEAVFKVNSLPAGESCVVLEANRREFNVEDVLTYDAENEDNYYYTRSAEEQAEFDVSDQIQVKYGESGLTVKNRGDESYDKIYVLYKIKKEGVYFGGITYKLEFTNLGAGMEMTRKTTHYSPDETDVIMVVKSS